MLPSASMERQLRRLVTELADMSEEDVAAILAELTEERRRMVSDLLRIYAGARRGGATKATRAVGIDMSRLSPWLVERLDIGRSTECAMTAHGREILRDCSRRLFASERVPDIGSDRTPSLAHRIGTYIGARAAR